MYIYIYIYIFYSLCKWRSGFRICQEHFSRRVRPPNEDSFCLLVVTHNSCG